MVIKYTKFCRAKGFFAYLGLCSCAFCVILCFVKKYALVLGKNKELSIAELGAVFGEKIKVAAAAGVVFVETDRQETAFDFLNKLGGAVEVLEIFGSGLTIEQAQEKAISILKENCADAAGKCAFAVNSYPEDEKVLRKILVKAKKALREIGIKANFINNNFKNAHAVAVTKQRLIERGANVTVIKEEGGLFAVGLCKAVQDFEKYSLRDYEKPFKDAHTGMMPPKLAQVMINLASVMVSPPNHNTVIYDPFCGTGTIPMEALLMGMSAIGSDAQARLIEGARKNTTWLREKFEVAANITSNIFQKDAIKITAADLGLKTGQKIAVVAEPYMGPPLSSWPAEAFLKKLMEDLSKLYFDFFKNLAQFAPAGTPVVFIFPVWNKPHRGEKTTGCIYMSAQLIDKIESLGYIKTAFVPLQKTSLIYSRPGQIVWREIVRFVKT